MEALGKFTLKKLILLVIYLDKAKNARLISHDPCLFNKNSQLKVSTINTYIVKHTYSSTEGALMCVASQHELGSRTFAGHVLLLKGNALMRMRPYQKVHHPPRNFCLLSGQIRIWGGGGRWRHFLSSYSYCNYHFIYFRLFKNF